MPAAPLPRRTAWSSPAELALVFDRLFHSDGDTSLQWDALSRVKVWIARGNCPHAVESTANLLELILADSGSDSNSSSSSSEGGAGGRTTPGELRLSYSMAIIRRSGEEGPEDETLSSGGFSPSLLGYPSRGVPSIEPTRAAHWAPSEEASEGCGGRG
ncbi:hypothetical protein JCM6882_005489 [Rhodosporidiobolus microsporus]